MHVEATPPDPDGGHHLSSWSRSVIVHLLGSWELTCSLGTFPLQMPQTLRTGRATTSLDQAHQSPWKGGVCEGRKDRGCSPSCPHVTSFNTSNSPANCRRIHGRRAPWRRSADTANDKGTQHPEPWLGSLWWMFHSCPQSSSERWFYCRPDNNDSNSQISTDHAELETLHKSRGQFAPKRLSAPVPKQKLPFAPRAHWRRRELFCGSKSFHYFAFQAYCKLMWQSNNFMCNTNQVAFVSDKNKINTYWNYDFQDEIWIISNILTWVSQTQKSPQSMNPVISMIKSVF